MDEHKAQVSKRCIKHYFNLTDVHLMVTSFKELLCRIKLLLIS
jgi:hypothetical protein